MGKDSSWYNEKEHPMKRRTLVSILMESPLYFRLTLQERLELVQEHAQWLPYCRPNLRFHPSIKSVSFNLVEEHPPRQGLLRLVRGTG